MLRNRSRAVTSKQALMADHSSQASPAQNYTNPIPSFFDSPRFKAFTSKAIPETEALKSPTSILDNKPFFPFCNPFALTRPKSPKVFSPGNPELKGIGLAILDTFSNDNQSEDNTSCEPNKRNLLFGTEPRVQIPHVTEMELSEDYTRVVSHGPNPRTTHIFDNCVVESCFSVPDNEPKPATGSFLSFCHTCNKNLEQKVDIYIYRGEKAFCSPECRYQEMILDGEEH